MKKLISKLCAFAFIITLAVSTTACGESRGSASKDGGKLDPANTTVGISLPEKFLPRWNKDGGQLQGLLEGAGFKVTLQYADNKTDLQASQIENMVNNGAKVIVVAAIDGTAVGPAVQKAKDAGCKVIAYDRLIMNTDAVDYYATFDSETVGKMQAQYIVDKLGLEDGKKGPFNIELFAGSPSDTNAAYVFKGAYSVLGKYLEDGTLNVPSGQKPANVDEWKKVATEGWKQSEAQSRMENLLNSYYNGGTKLDAALSPNDSIALGIENAFEQAGKGYFPLITGQDADAANVKAIVDGKISMSVWKDTRELAQATFQMIQEIAEGKTVTVDKSDSTFNNGVKNVPTRLLNPVTVDKDLVQSKLVDSGYITAEEAGL